ncbi:non-hydrolyzing UDP-N-acetylglucosamine 2-epimerase [Fretibacterium sp. OH1220_COT-178]|uniref:non-hydrolyzing UDP-N-acetylglucosamine 2-epimerase n=1 Tax=Fretibacterium sp. OH1220_COT-178 TaxID=2491047 RepID=UPI000F60369F|nr:UDP-N-acetylglucosamine 2-epimerase (non-hydrolyzing) [Fretibacterium sp. OH1220_COT-178]RRD64760.1 UDP-N-acetylglucosamine 2-epimerase (non-hydrolyzing) [Fretibacterium sp. OH1220_COT-178]
MRRVTCVVGTRPEAIKMAPLIRLLREDGRFAVTVLASGQHTDMLQQALAHFCIDADVNLNVMRERQTLDHVTSAVLLGVGAFLDRAPQDMLLVHGDTTTTLGAALAGFYRGVPVGHVEAGLRSHNMALPFPEEANRVLTDRLASLHFAPTPRDAENLRREGASEARIFVTGNTVIDALYWTLENLAPAEILRDVPEDVPLVLMTAHRRESWGTPLVSICEGVAALLREHPEVRVLVPLHKNPAVRDVIRRELGASPQVILTEPLSYPDFVSVMNRSLFIVSDSGGIQEEASALRKPVLILREVSERPEAIFEGTGVLVGTRPDAILRESLRLLEDPAYRAVFSERGMPFGDGRASSKIRDVVLEYLDGAPREGF